MVESAHEDAEGARPAVPPPARPGSTTGRQASQVDAALRRFSFRLAKATDSPRLEAEVLTGHVLGLSRTELLAYPER